MKKIINSKRYDTETATFIADTNNGCSRTDFNFWEEELYRKQTGEFFLHGIGGAMSRYSKSCGNNEWAGDEVIIPLSIDAAKKWAETYMDADEYESIFGEVTEDNSKSSCTFSLQTNTIARIADLAAEWKCTKSEVIDKAIQQLTSK